MTNRPLLGLRFAVWVNTGFLRHIVSIAPNSAESWISCSQTPYAEGLKLQS
jgi:hypothetical protein